MAARYPMFGLPQTLSHFFIIIWQDEKFIKRTDNGIEINTLLIKYNNF